MFAWNTTPNEQVGSYTPYELVYGKKPSLPSFFENQIEPVYDYDNYASCLKHLLNQASQHARQSLLKRKLVQSENSAKISNPLNVKVGELVKLSNEARSKLDPFYLGPFKVLDIKEPNAIIDKDGSKYEIHKNKLLPFNQ